MVFNSTLWLLACLKFIYYVDFLSKFHLKVMFQYSIESDRREQEQEALMKRKRFWIDFVHDLHNLLPLLDMCATFYVG